MQERIIGVRDSVHSIVQSARTVKTAASPSHCRAFLGGALTVRRRLPTTVLIDDSLDSCFNPHLAIFATLRASHFSIWSRALKSLANLRLAAAFGSMTAFFTAAVSRADEPVGAAIYQKMC